MAKSELEIVNLGLAAAGATKLLSGELATAQGAEAVFARTFYPQRRDELLEIPGSRWPFAIRRVVLAALEGVTRTDWAYVYALPADCRTARQVVLPGMRNPRGEDVIPFALEAGDPDPDAAEDDPFAGEPTSTIVLCDLAAAELLYTANVTNPARFSALFTSALGERLAIDFATHLTKKDDLARSAERRYLAALGQAQVHAAQQGQKDPPPVPDFLEGYDGPERSSRFRFGVK
jgi:hypothetical protein